MSHSIPLSSTLIYKAVLVDIQLSNTRYVFNYRLTIVICNYDQTWGRQISNVSSYSYIFCVVYVVIGCIFLSARKDKTTKYFSCLLIFSYDIYMVILIHILLTLIETYHLEFIRMNIKVSNVWSFSEHLSGWKIFPAILNSCSAGAVRYCLNKPACWMSEGSAVVAANTITHYTIYCSPK